jgi:hypothetical protein
VAIDALFGFYFIFIYRFTNIDTSTLSLHYVLLGGIGVDMKLVCFGAVFT